MTYQPKHILTKNLIALTRGYFDRIVKPSLEATNIAVGRTAKIYRIAEKNICVYFYGEAVASVFSLALAHLQIPESKNIELTIHVWDSSYSKRYMLAPWDDSVLHQDETDEDESFLGVYVSGEESLSFFDRASHTGYFWINDVCRITDAVVGAPFRTILHWFLNDSDVHFIHGAVVGQNGRSVLLTAKSGSGKSTTALSCAIAGMDYLADDYVALDCREDVTAHSLYHSLKITRAGLDIFPDFEKHVWNKDFGDNEKAVMFLSDIFPKQIKITYSLSAILIPRIAGGQTRIERASKIEAMLAIAPTTLLQLPLAETKKIGAFKKILENVPCYFLDLGSNFTEIPIAIKSFLNEP